ncbi:helix-turn-helix transcriptional regulator [Nitratidesulfovibrio sp.]|uniref:helix-turn-helix domain-containing protein n=1 Tax=Nitratidesulfovibrio sp. TaxID=2802297 RepID=UPI0033418768
MLPESILDMSPAAILRGLRYREGMTQAVLSRRTGIPQRHISEMENHRRPIATQNARKLAEALSCPLTHFLSTSP